MCLSRVRVISAAPSARSPRRAVISNNAINRPVCSCHHEEKTRQNHKSNPAQQSVPLGGPYRLPERPVIIDPHETHELERHDTSKEGSVERRQRAEDGNGTGDNVRRDGDANRATEPAHPVSGGIRRQMLRPTQETHKKVLSRNLRQSCG